MPRFMQHRVTQQRSAVRAGREQTDEQTGGGRELIERRAGARLRWLVCLSARSRVARRARPTNHSELDDVAISRPIAHIDLAVVKGSLSLYVRLPQSRKLVSSGPSFRS